MAEPLPALRTDLDLMPSPVEDRPGLLIRDPLGFATAVLIIPPPLVPLLMMFDGRRTELDLREALVRLTGRLEVGAIVGELRRALGQSGFLRDESFAALSRERRRAFVEAAWRDPAHAGSGYPREPEALGETLRGWLGDVPSGADGAAGPLAIAAPHVSPAGGFRSYAASYGALGPERRGRSFAILGTSHYGEPERLGLTRKPFRTPLGETRADRDRVDELAARAGGAAVMEDYCHAVEHSIEFQVLFLQQLYGADVTVLPILCGPFARALEGGFPEDDPAVGRALEALAGLAGDEELVWVLGVDMAHVGRRYGDAVVARADEGPLRDVAARDRERIERLAAGDAHGFWELVRERGDELRWCGSAPLYAFLRAAAPGPGALLRYEQWNIDEASVVSFAAMRFDRAVGG